MIEVRNNGNRIAVYFNQVLEEKDNIVTVLDGKMTFTQSFVGPKDVAVKQVPDKPAFFLSKDQAKELGTLLLSESRR